MAFNFSADTTKTSKKADNPLIEDGYDVDADTVMEYYGKTNSTPDKLYE